MRREVLLAWFAARAVRVLCSTLRYRVEDRAGVLDPANREQFIWSIWHNRVLVVPLFVERRFRHRCGAVLTSASRDGEILARVVAHFGIEAERGSSSRRGASALLALVRRLKRGEDVAVTPDGPRGPRYRIGPGLIYLAQQSGVRILPVSIEFSSSKRLRSWDRFFVPMPFSVVRLVFCDPIEVRPAEGGEATEAERLRVERLLAGLVEEE